MPERAEFMPVEPDEPEFQDPWVSADDDVDGGREDWAFERWREDGYPDECD